MSETWLPSLITATPQEGYDLAILMSRVAVKKTQPDAAVRDKLRTVYESDADALIAVSAVVASIFKRLLQRMITGRRSLSKD